MAQHPGSSTESELSTILSFFHQVKARFASSDPAVYDEFLRIFLRYSRGETTDPSEAIADAYEILGGHPDLVHRLETFFPAGTAPPPVPAREDPEPTPTLKV